jgi:SH3 domain-containing protein
MWAMRLRAAAAGLALLASGCASSGKRAVDLSPARQAVEAARQAGAAEKATSTFGRAEERLKEAERLSNQGGTATREAAVEAEWLARLALTEAQCEQRADDAQTARSASSQALEQLRGRLRRSEDEEHRLEERAALLQRDLEMTETELIRTKARLKGIEGKSEASSAIAEAQILVRRLEQRGKTAVLSLCRESLTKAEQQLAQENYGAAMFFAMKAQDLAVKAGEGTERRAGPPPAETDQVPPQPTYTVQASRANIRRGPGPTEPVVGRAPKGSVLPARAVRGDWIMVTHRDVTGWVYRPLLK